jgi:hypothetical protein
MRCRRPAVQWAIFGCDRLGGHARIDPRMLGAMSTPLPDLVLYTRPGCHLCDETRALVQGLLEDRAARGRRTAAIRERDITTDPDLERAFFDRIPVVELAGRRLELAVSFGTLRRFIDDGMDGNLA